MSLAGLRVLALETRRAKEMAELIRRHRGEPVVVPSMREIPLTPGAELFEAVEELLAGKIAMVIFFTGVGVRNLYEVLAPRYPAERINDIGQSA